MMQMIFKRDLYCW